VTGEGMAAFTGDVAASQEEAVWDAKRNAVEQAVGIFLKSRTMGSGFSVEDDEIQGRTQGFVRRWEVVEGSRRIETVTTGGRAVRVLHIEVRATVGLLPLIRRLADIADVYKDLERPRIRVSITAKSPNSEAAERLQADMAGALRAQGFEVASEGSAEVVLKGVLDITPTVRMGDGHAPYGVGDMVAACRARLTLQAVSTVSEDVLFAHRAETSGRSFQNDQEACQDALTQLTATTIEDNTAQLVPHLLARWAGERQEGHVVMVRADGLTDRQRDLLKQTLSDMRGFRRIVDEQHTAHRLILRFLTRRDTRSVRRDLAALDLNTVPLPAGPAAITARNAIRRKTAERPRDAAPSPNPLLVLNDRGPIIDCAAHASAASKARR
jgi:hypothetical protein